MGRAGDAGELSRAVVTGAARGIGLEIASMLLERGGRRVFLADRDAGALEIAVERLQREYGKTSAEALVVDLAEEEEVEKLIGAVCDGGGGLSLLVNNAATSAPGPCGELSAADWNRVLAVNLTAPFLLSRGLASLLRESSGAIVNICSTRALMSEAGTEAYSAAKGGLLSLTHALAMSLAPDVRVNAVSPGWINSAGEALSAADHAQHPAGRVGIPEDVAAMVLYLASGAAGFITGQNFIVDGGMTRRMIYTE